MTTNTTPVLPPSDPYAAVDWLMARHEWPRHLVARVIPGGVGNPSWLDDFADVLAAHDAEVHAWNEYAELNPLSLFATEAQTAAWEAHGPDLPARHLGDLPVMSSGERRMCRLIATLHPSRRTSWSVGDVDFDERGIRFYVEVTAVVLAPFTRAYPHTARTVSALLGDENQEG